MNQALRYYGWYRNRRSAATPSDVTTISFTNTTSPLHKVARSGREHVGTITPPTGYSVTSWSIINHRTRLVVATAATDTVTHTFIFASMADCNTYDLQVEVGDGISTFSRIFPGEFTCLPAVPTVFDVTWNTSGDKGMGWIDRAGQAILATGDMTSRLNPYWLKSDDPTRPVHVVLKDLSIITSSVGCFHLTAMKNVIFDGCTKEEVQYGAVLGRSGAGTAQQFQLLGAEPNDNTKTSANVTICGIEANGGNIADSTGNTAFRILNNRDAANHEGTFTFNNLTMFNLYGHDSWEEVFYLGQSEDSLDVNSRGYPYYTNALYYRFRGENGGNEVFQCGLNRNFDVFGCDFRNGGIRNQNQHENLIQWSDGNLNGAFYMNYLEQGTHNLIAYFTGRTGGDSEFFSNVMYTLGKDADGGGNLWGRLDNHDTDLEHNYIFRHNTIIYSVGTAFTNFAPSTPTTLWNKFNATANLIVGENTTDYEDGGGFTAANGHIFEFNNAKFLTADIGNVLFVDSANKDYHLSSLTSPAFGVYSATPMASPFGNYDYEGYGYESDVAGAHSGYELML
jgi:hypothetical protein